MSKKGYQHIVLQTVSRGIIFRQFCRRKVHGNAAVRAGWQRRRRDGAFHMTKAAHARACPRFTVCSAASRGPVPNRSSLSSGMSHDHSRSDIFVRKMPIKAFSRGIAEQNRLQAAVGGNMFFPLNEQPGVHFTKRRRLPGHGAGVFAEYSSRFFKNRRLRGRTLLHSTS